MKFLPEIEVIHNKQNITITLIVIIWHIILILIGQLIDNSGIEKNLISYIVSKDTVPFLSHILRWDSGWLLEVTNDLYKDNLPSAAFYPLFPFMSLLISKVSFNLLSIPESGFIVNILSSSVATLMVYKIAHHFFKESFTSLLTMMLFLTFPSAFFMHVFYTEALFCALAFSSYYLALKRNWLASCFILSILTSARLPSVLFLGLVGLEYFRSIEWSVRKINYNALYFLLTPIGFILYGLLLQYRTGNFFAMFSAYKATTDWSYHVFNINFIETVYKTLTQSKSYIEGAYRIDRFTFISNYFMPLFGYFILLLSSLYSIFKIKSYGIPLGLFGILSSIMFTLNSNMVSVHRYVLPCLVIYISLADFLKRYLNISQMAAYTFLLVFFMSQISLFFFFVVGHFMG